MKKSIFVFAVALLSYSSKVDAVQVQAVESISFSVADLDRSLDFYTHVLNFKKVTEFEMAGDDAERLFGIFGMRVRVARLQLGDDTIELREFLAPEGQLYPSDTRSNDLWVQNIAIAVSDIDSAYYSLRKNKVHHISPNPQQIPSEDKAITGQKLFYFRDPDGHRLELTQIVTGKENSKYLRSSNDIFLGIDHTTILVSSTAASLNYYRDTLGFKVTGERDRAGIETERLENIYGAHVHITEIQVSSGPAIHLLEYVTPVDGRPVPKNIRPNDLASTETLLVVDNLPSSHPISTSEKTVRFPNGLLTHDPDKHAILLMSK